MTKKISKEHVKPVIKIVAIIILIIIAVYMLIQAENLVSYAYDLNRPHGMIGSFIFLIMMVLPLLISLWILNTFFTSKKAKRGLKIIGIVIIILPLLSIPLYKIQFDEIKYKIDTKQVIPGYEPDLLVALGVSAWESGKLDSAMAYFDEAIFVYEYFGDKYYDFRPYNMKAWIMATEANSTYYNPQRAVEYALIAVNITGWQEPNSIDTLAVAYAALGDYDKAYLTEQKAVELSPNEEIFQERIKKYESLRNSE